MRRTAAAIATVLSAGFAATVSAGTAQGAAGPCEAGPATHEIAQVQGTGTATPLSGQTVRVEGTVTGDFQRTDQLSGFFIQDPTPDGDPRTSDGLFVFSRATEVEPGDRVAVTGRAIEFNGLTELSPVTAVDVCGTARGIKPAKVKLPLDRDTESYEGVLLRYGQRLTATETFQLGRFGEVTASAGGRLFQPTEGRGDTQAENDRRRILIDDGSNVQNPAAVPFTDPHVLRIGDSTTNLTGVLSFGFGRYRLQPTRDTHFERTNPRPARPAPVGGDVKVAGFNTLNWFTTLDSRGADTAAEQERQIAKLVAALKGLDADAVGLMEVENNGDTAIGALVDRLNAAVGAGTYGWIRNPAPGTDQIQVAIIYKSARLRPVGAPRSSDAPVFERPPLAQTFERASGGGAPFTMIVNHFKSKNCDGAAGPDQDQGDGQGCFNARRVTQATALAALAAQVPGPLVLGDLNAYSAEDPVDVLTSAGLVGQTERFVRDEQRYSFVFDAMSGELDHVLAGSALSGRVTGATIWHINSDEPLILDYNTEFNPPGLYRPDAYRSSDHDPVLVGLRLR